MILVYKTIPGAGNISPLPCGKQAISKNVGFRGPYVDVRLILQPFLLVTLPDFKLHHKLYVLSMYCVSFHLPYSTQEKTKPFPRNRSFRRPFSPLKKFSLFVTHIMTTRAFLASRQTRPAAGLVLFTSVLS